ncbi:hypothetical protein C0J52_13897 [Blattella germanica]|nr:hypothetical protein C0J52_13897 [Blattella germanica]
MFFKLPRRTCRLRIANFKCLSNTKSHEIRHQFTYLTLLTFHYLFICDGIEKFYF